MSNVNINNNLSSEKITEYPVYRLPFPHDPQSELAREVYGPSKSAEHIYDGRRKLVAEAFDFSVISSSLVATIVRLLVKWYKGGRLDASLSKSNRVLFGELLDTELPIETVVLLNNDTYWRRVVQKKTKYKFTHLNESRSEGFSYKKLALGIKFTDLIESTSPELWNLDYLRDLSAKLSPFITELSISQLQSRSQLLLDKNLGVNAEYRIHNYPIDECNHGDLSFLPALRNLQELSIEFGVRNLAFKFQKRHFEFSYKDIDILSDTVPKMPSLKSFSIRRSLFTNRKIESLMRGLSDCSCLEKLELSFCQLTSTKAIAEFLSVNNTLSALELKGNYLSGNEVADLAEAINQYKGNLCYLGLAQNPLQSIGLQSILYSILDTQQVNDLDISGVTHDADDVPYIINFVASHAILRALNLTAIPLMETHGETLVAVLRGHYGILRMPHKSCGLSEEQEKNLRILLDRNNYYEANPILHNNEITAELEKEVDLIMKQKIHPLLEDKVMPDFFQDDESKGDHESSNAAENNYPQSAYTENEFVDHVGFY